MGQPYGVQAVDEGEEVGWGDDAVGEVLTWPLVRRGAGEVVVCGCSGGQGGRVGARKGAVDGAVQGVGCFCVG